MPALPEQQALTNIDRMLNDAGWADQDYKAFDPSVSIGIALSEVPLNSGRCDYLLLVNRKPVGVVEAKKEGTSLSTVADQSAHYAENLPDFLAAGLGSDSLPFRYESTGVQTFFREERDPHPRPRRVFCFHRPEILVAKWMDSITIATGTDIRPLGCLLFLHDVRSRVYFEPMKGRGTHVLTPTDLQSVSGAEAKAKTHFIIADTVGVCESDKTESRPLKRKPTVAFKKLHRQFARSFRDKGTLIQVA
jgi:type I site-specific restriction endonuclease